MTKLWNLDKEQRNRAEMNPAQLPRCVYCGHPAKIVWVHGHGQCSNCGINTEECCRGETCGNE
jgi:hypothetical protein